MHGRDGGALRIDSVWSGYPIITGIHSTVPATAIVLRTCTIPVMMNAGAATAMMAAGTMGSPTPTIAIHRAGMFISG